jgi:hypothetical protein
VMLFVTEKFPEHVLDFHLKLLDWGNGSWLQGAAWSLTDVNDSWLKYNSLLWKQRPISGHKNSPRKGRSVKSIVFWSHGGELGYRLDPNIIPESEFHIWLEFS